MQRRTVGLLLAGVGATLILVSVLSRTWLVGARGEAPVRVGLTRAESCKPGHDDAGRPETRCETASVATLLREGTPRRDYDDAYAACWSGGYDDGYGPGYDDGYGPGWDDGYGDGYDSGYSDGASCS